MRVQDGVNCKTDSNRTWGVFRKILGVPSVQVVLYTRPDCPLCDEAHHVLVQHGLRPKLVNLDDEPALLPVYCHCIPVVIIDGKVRFRGKINPMLLRRLLNSAQGERRNP